VTPLVTEGRGRARGRFARIATRVELNDLAGRIKARGAQAGEPNARRVGRDKRPLSAFYSWRITEPLRATSLVVRRALMMVRWLGSGQSTV
jgi:hypothetical protein